MLFHRYKICEADLIAGLLYGQHAQDSHGQDPTKDSCRYNDETEQTEGQAIDSSLRKFLFSALLSWKCVKVQGQA